VTPCDQHAPFVTLTCDACIAAKAPALADPRQHPRSSSMRTDPAPWDDVEEALKSPPTLTPEQSRDLVQVIPDDTQAVLVSYRDPAAVEAYLRDLRPAMRERVRALLLAQAEQRLDVGGAGLTRAVVAPEVRLAADIEHTLKGVASAILVGAEEAREYAGEVMREVVEAVKPVGTTSERFADGHGGSIRVASTQASKPTVNADEVRDILAEHLAHTLATDDLVEAVGRSVLEADEEDVLTTYRLGVRHGIAALLDLASPTWRTTALKSLGEAIADADYDGHEALEVRLELAQGRRLVGAPKVTIERTDKA
jgi:hypothetical protein